jgi:hypothetical protein
MLRKVLLTLGGLLLLAAEVCAAAGFYSILPQLLIGGVILTAGIAWERWQYKKPKVLLRPNPHWQATGERFVDPGSGALLEVYYDPRNGERHYVTAGSPAAPR